MASNQAIHIEITDNSGRVKEEMQAVALCALEKCGLVAEGHAKRICPVAPENGGTLRNSITHRVDSAEPAVYIGTNVEYAPYVELGTGKYYPGGRRTPWTYQDAYGRWHLTYGQRAQPYLKPAIADNVQQYKGIIESELRG